MKYKPTVKAKAPKEESLRGIGKFDWSSPLISTKKRLAATFVDEDAEPKSKSKKVKTKCPLCGNTVKVKNNRISPHYKDKIAWWWKIMNHPVLHCPRKKLIE